MLKQRRDVRREYTEETKSKTCQTKIQMSLLQTSLDDSTQRLIVLQAMSTLCTQRFQSFQEEH